MNDIFHDLKALASPQKAANSRRFFKTGPGQYGEGDEFWGLTVPEQRTIAKKYKDLPLEEISTLLKNPVHECRLTGLIILVSQFRKSGADGRKRLAAFYLKHKKAVNNWDLVDTSASNILGVYLLDKDRAVLYKMAKSKNLWERRIAIIATLAFIAAGQFADTLKISEMLLGDPHDLMHKAVGWMLREVGKRDVKTIENFLAAHAARMPRTMLRYAIEKFPANQRHAYLNQ